VPFQKRRLVGIPESLFQYYNSGLSFIRCPTLITWVPLGASVTSHMGLIPEIERVWITIDHKLFLWDYVEGYVCSDCFLEDCLRFVSQEISSFVDQPDVISHVAAVKTKRGVFIDEITHLLVICTPVSVLLIGLSISPASTAHSRSHREIRLYATDMTLPTDIEMTSVIGTQDGRIFMSGSQDGNLYEFHYQENESWFGKRVQLINHSIGGVQSLFPKFVGTRAEGQQTDCMLPLWLTYSNRSDHLRGRRPFTRLLLHPDCKKQHIRLQNERRQSYTAHSDSFRLVQAGTGEGARCSVSHTAKFPHNRTTCCRFLGVTFRYSTPCSHIKRGPVIFRTIIIFVQLLLLRRGKWHLRWS
jgi:hypothetical protein